MQEKKGEKEALNFYDLAVRVIKGRGLKTEPSKAELREVELMKEFTHEEIANKTHIKDMRDVLFFSIDNEDTRDIDQLTFAKITDSGYQLFVAIADCTELVKKKSSIDRHAAHNTATIYTPIHNFTMLPEKLCTDLTSLNLNKERLAIVVQMEADKDGVVTSSTLYEACVINKAKLDYINVAAWLLEQKPIPDEVKKIEGLVEQLKLHHEIAQKIRQQREKSGSLEFESIELTVTMKDGLPVEVVEVTKNNVAQQIIENFMVAANNSCANFLSSKQFPVLRRVVKTPEKWDKIIRFAGKHHFKLGTKPDAKQLQHFLRIMREKNPTQFPDLSLTVIKLLGRGEYIFQAPDEQGPGHFALALRDYTHSTAPNRRFIDLVTQRMVKAAIHNEPCPYSNEELEMITLNCTEKEAEIDKIQRTVTKSAIAYIMQHRLKEKFQAIVVGTPKRNKVWIKLLHPEPPIEGRLVRGFEGLEVGDYLEVMLKRVSIVDGHIDFKRVD